MRIVYTRNGAVTPHGDEVTTRLKSRTKCGPDRPSNRYRGAPAYEIAEELFPTEDELVVDKLTSSAFHNTMLDHAPHNFGITDVVITGVLADMCILGTARVASELGYNVLIAEDTCAHPHSARPRRGAAHAHPSVRSGVDRRRRDYRPRACRCCEGGTGAR